MTGILVSLAVGALFGATSNIITSDQPSTPIAFTLYRGVNTGYDTWRSAETNGACPELLAEAKPYFNSVSFVIDFARWHQGNPENPTETVIDGYLHVDPASENLVTEVARCMSQAKALRFNPIVLKIKIMDYISPKPTGPDDGFWRAKIPFDPFNGNYLKGALGPVDLGLRILRSYSYRQHAKNLNDVILSVSDEYIRSITKYGEKWALAYDTIREKLATFGITVRLGINLDWLTTSYVDDENKEGFARSLSKLDIIGWSLYRPFLGFLQFWVKLEQLGYVRDLRQFLDNLGLTHIPMAIFEFGVTSRIYPSDWDRSHLSRADQERAYRGWLEMLQAHEAPLELFTFWANHYDPRLTSAECLRNYLHGRPISCSSRPRQISK